MRRNVHERLIQEINFEEFYRENIDFYKANVLQKIYQYILCRKHRILLRKILCNVSHKICYLVCFLE